MSVWFIRAALLYLAGGLSVGALLLLEKGLAVPPRLAAWLPVHLEWLLVGWLVQLVMGVAYWMFPRFGMSRAARGREGLAWVALVLLNTGMALAAGGALLGRPGWTFAGRVVEAGAVVTLGMNIWSRTRSSGISAM